MECKSKEVNHVTKDKQQEAASSSKESEIEVPDENNNSDRSGDNIRIDIIIEKLYHAPPSHQTSFICRLPHKIRNVRKDAFDPMLLSIGPYHYDKRKDSLQYMEVHKLRYLNDLIKRKQEAGGESRDDQLNKYFKALKQLEVQARSYYSEPIGLDTYHFLEMMLLDGCFIIELFRKATWGDYKHEREMDPLFKIRGMRNKLIKDLIIVENQIPFFILEELHRLMEDTPNPLRLVFTAVRFLYPYSHLPQVQRTREFGIARQSISNLAEGGLFKTTGASESRLLDGEKLKDIKHLLDLYRKFMLIEEVLVIREPPEANGDQIGSAYPAKYTYCATELRDLGVRFKSVEKSKLYDIKFDNGILEIPVIRIPGSTEALFHNLIAYEQHAHSDDIKYVVDYVLFMDGLIRTSKDVELLRREGIIESITGDDEGIATMFNKIVKDAAMLTKKFYYKKTVHNLMEHCRKKRHAWMAELRWKYLKSPWAIAGILVTFVLLVSTLVQTIYSGLSYKKA